MLSSVSYASYDGYTDVYKNVFGIKETAYNIYYDLDGGEWDEAVGVGATSYERGESGYVPPTPVKDGYIFDSWSPESIPEGSTGDITFVASWITIKSITYDARGGNFMFDDTKIADENPRTVKLLYYYPSTSLALTRADLDDDYDYDNVLDDKCILISGKVIEPYLYGYDFDGWYLDKSYSTKYEFSEDLPDKVTVYAKWKNTTAVLKTGKEFNTVMKKFATGLWTGIGWGNIFGADYTTSNILIYSIEISDDAPPSSTNTTVISADDSANEVVAWTDKSGTVYVYSESPIIYFNPDSSYMFSRFKNLKSIDMSKFDSSLVTDASYMFYDNESVPSLDLSLWNTDSVENMSNMFSSCNSLQTLVFGDDFDLSNVENFDDMFSNTASSSKSCIVICPENVKEKLSQLSSVSSYITFMTPEEYAASQGSSVSLDMNDGSDTVYTLGTLTE
jgi:uncharacterized repeat protein (TIGR02543 family)